MSPFDPLSAPVIGAGDRLRRAMEIVLRRRRQHLIDALTAEQQQDAKRRRIQRKKRTKTLSEQDETHVVRKPNV